MERPRLHCQDELDADLGYEGLLPDAVLQRWAGDRYSTSKHLLTLYAIARGLGAREIVEIGFGRSTFVLARAAAENGGHLTSCDKRDFRCLLSPRERAVTRCFVGSSSAFWQQWTRPIDFAFLDHLSIELLSHESATAEITACLDRLRPDGILAIHDCHDPRYQVGAAAAKIAEAAGSGVLQWVTLPYNYGLGILRKLPAAGAPPRPDPFIKKPDALPSAVDRAVSGLSVYNPPADANLTPTLWQGRKLRILYLCQRSTFERKMSRVRFHSMAAIGEVADVTWSGPGWTNWEDRASVQANVDRLYGTAEPPDLIVGYKPLEMTGFAETRAPRCLRYNEMYDEEATLAEIRGARANLVVCHHRNDLDRYAWLLRDFNEFPIQLSGIAHCAESSIYRDYGLPKTMDALLVGAWNIHMKLGQHYPLRDRIPAIFQRLAPKYRCGVLKHPGYDLGDASLDRNSVFYAQQLNAAKICVTCSGVPRSRVGKYVEIPMSASALAADLPDEDHEFFRSFMIVLDPDDPDDVIADTLAYYVEHDAERDALVQRGLTANRIFTQAQYAARFLRAAVVFLDGRIAKP